MVEISTGAGLTWPVFATVEPRNQYGLQLFRATATLGELGTYGLIVRVNCESGSPQPLKRRRNHVHCIDISFA